MSDSFPTFTRLLAPIGVEDFFQDRWEQQLVHVRREIPDYYHEVLKIEDLDHYFQTQHISPQFLTVLKDGDFCPADQWSHTEQKVGGRTGRTVIDLKKLLALFNDGATIIINSAETAIPTLMGLNRALESELKFPVQSNIYITPSQKQGFVPHFDTHNVFILQIHGIKYWNLYDTPIEAPVNNVSLESSKYHEREPRQAIQLHPGDLLYVPRGMVHCAKSDERTSIHVTIGPMVSHWTDVLRLLAQRADEDAAFRRLLPHGLSSPQEIAEFAAAFKTSLQNLLEQTDLPAMIYANFLNQRRTDGRNRFRQTLEIDDLTINSVVCRENNLDYLIKRNDQWIIISFEEEELSVPLFLELSMVKILQDKPFSICQIEGIPNAAGKLALIKRFVRAGFLKIISV